MPLMQGVKYKGVGQYSVAVRQTGEVMVCEADGALEDGTVYVASANYALGGGGTANMCIATGDDTWGVKVQVVTGGWATAQFCEDIDVPVLGTNLIPQSLNRPSPYIADPVALGGRLAVVTDSLAFVCGTQLCEAFTGACEGVVLGEWILNPNSNYGIEVTDVTLIANVVNITATFYLVEEA